MVNQKESLTQLGYAKNMWEIMCVYYGETKV